MRFDNGTRQRAMTILVLFPLMCLCDTVSIDGVLLKAETYTRSLKEGEHCPHGLRVGNGKKFESSRAVVLSRSLRNYHLRYTFRKALSNSWSEIIRECMRMR